MADVLGFKVLRPLTFDDLQILAITDAVPLVRQQQCPACVERDLDVIATLSGSNGGKKIRVGYCPGCGYAGYIDRPTAEWIMNFYSSGMWDRTREDGDHKSERRIARVAQGRFGKKNDTVRMIETLEIDRSRSVLEIGCGYGESLGHLKWIGFERILGIEHSPRRADVAADNIEGDIFTGAFEAPDIQKSLAQKGPFGLIFSHHTLEHVYDPAEFVAHAARLQQDGDYLVLAVPNIVGESSMAILTFLPHLHSFSLTGLSRLLGRFGYEVIDSAFTTTRVLNVIARKSSGKTYLPLAVGGDIATAMRDKITRGLGLDRPLPRSHLRRFWWYKKSDLGGQIAYFANPFFEALHYAMVSRVIARRFGGIARNQKILSVAVTDLDKNVIPENPPPFVIQFDGPLVLFYK